MEIIENRQKHRQALIIFLTIALAIAAHFACPHAFASEFGAVRGVVHDPQHRPMQDAAVVLRAKSADWTKSATTDAAGQFQFNAVPLEHIPSTL